MIVPLGQDAIAAMVALQQAFPTKPLVLIGAAALGCHIAMKWRRTEDLDLVVALSIEDATRTLHSLTGWSQNKRKEHEWRSPQGILIDLLPVSDQALASVSPLSGRAAGIR
ncbi:MAG: hypothetical protein HY901_12060 [Deltaproteobacteria bacterium]|nr:hypothetical protein [Deltaproteobacteria bacterium]